MEQRADARGLGGLSSVVFLARSAAVDLCAAAQGGFGASVEHAVAIAVAPARAAARVVQSVAKDRRDATERGVFFAADPRRPRRASVSSGHDADPQHSGVRDAERTGAAEPIPFAAYWDWET